MVQYESSYLIHNTVMENEEMVVIRLALNCPFKFITDSWRLGWRGQVPGDIDDRLHIMQKEPFYPLIHPNFM
jgi:hypothetical protein